MSSTTLADYQVIMGGAQTIEYHLSNPDFPRSFERNFIWPDDLHTAGKSRRPVLTFNIQPVSSCQFTVWLNNVPVVSDINFSASHTRAHSQAFSFDRPLRAGITSNGKVPFRILMSKGRAQFSDIVIWYQINR